MSKAPIDTMLDGVKWVAVGRDPELENEPEYDGLPFATHEGVLEIIGSRLRCYQLSDGSRVFHADDVAALFGGVVE